MVTGFGILVILGLLAFISKYSVVEVLSHSGISFFSNYKYEELETKFFTIFIGEV
jgi:hypothetical protein